MPKNNVADVSLSIEFDATEIRGNKTDARWLSNRAHMFGSSREPSGKPWCSLSIKMSTDEFKKSLGVMEREGCSQRLISHFKYARDLGAKWVIFK